MPSDFNLFIEVCAIISLASIFSWDQLHGNFVNWKANHEQTLKVQKFNCVKSLKVHVKSRKLCRLAINCCRRCQLWGEFTSIVISWKFTNTTSFVFVLSAALQFIAKNLRSETFLIASSVNQKPSTMRLAFLYFALILNFDWICAIFKDADNENGSYKVGATMMQFPYAVKIFSRDNQKTLSGYSCSGSIVHQLWIATAAHCVFGFKIFDVFIGNVTNDANHVVRATHVFIHPDFTVEPELLNDFALLKLKRSLDTLNNSKSTPWW